MKKQKLVSASFDEASSSDSDDSSSDDDASSAGSNSEAFEDEHGQDELDRKDASSSTTSGDDDDESGSDQETMSDEDRDDASGSEDDEPVLKQSSLRADKSRNNADDGSSDSDDDEDEDEKDLPLQDRIRRNDAKGLSLKLQRERKRNALEVASERLAKFKKAKIEETSSSSPATKKKKSKHAPTEASSKRADFFRRGAPRLNESGVGVEVGAHRYKPLDPRASSLSGHLNEEQFEKNYEFLQEMRNKEISQLKKQIAARKLTGKKGKRMRRQLNVSIAEESMEEDEQRLRQLKQEKADFERRKIERTAKQSVKRKIQVDVEEGKSGAYFLKRKERKRLEFEAKMEELKKRGGHKAVEKALDKRRRKAKSRDAGLFAK